LAEISRVLLPGGVFIFVTPNAQHPLTGANRVLGRVGRLQGQLVSFIYNRAEEDTFPTAYKANSRSVLSELAQSAGLLVGKLVYINDPTYLAFSSFLFRLSSLIDEKLPEHRRVHIVGLLQKPI
jgi:SAM-dependent methyltransferase